MDESTLAAQMLEEAKEVMKYVRAKGSLGDNPSWGKSKDFILKQKRGGQRGRPDGYKTKIYKLLDKDMTTDEIVAILDCSRNIVNQYRRKRKLEQNAASSHAA